VQAAEAAEAAAAKMRRWTTARESCRRAARAAARWRGLPAGMRRATGRCMGGWQDFGLTGSHASGSPSRFINRSLLVSVAQAARSCSGRSCAPRHDATRRKSRRLHFTHPYPILP